MGYGVLQGEEEPLTILGYGTLSVPSTRPIAVRLHHLHQALLKIIISYQPTEVAVEEPFVAQNVRSALAIGQAQAVAIIAATSQGVPVYNYTPTQIKRIATGFGKCGKEQVQEILKIQLGLPTCPDTDAADALAVSLCHVRQQGFDRLLPKKNGKSR